ncbi:MAG: PEGA domain-containing protein, partial [Prevotellaceae bacterium]|nr:PEGA domain-containing protein [Prevotellaceae bacterium]
MKNKLLKHVVAVALLLIGNAVAAQEIAVESFTADETDQTARVASPRKDQNGKVCAIVKIETVLLLQDFNFDAGSSGIAHTEQKAGEIWVYLSPGTLRLTIQHTHLGVIRNYQFGEALKEATVYIMKLKSGRVTTVIEANVALQYIEIVCAEEGATVRIDDTEPEPFVEGKFQKLLSYGKHKYTVEAPGYHPESGMAEITAQKSEPVKIALKPKFG